MSRLTLIRIVAAVVSLGFAELAMAQAAARPEFGALALGLFVGVILCLGIQQAGGQLRAAATALGVALGAGPLFFLKNSTAALWTYPIALVLGMSLLALFRSIARVEAEDSTPRVRRSAWVQIAVVCAAIIAAAVYAALPDGYRAMSNL